MGKNRLEAFSDGVIAIIITIMVLELKVPHGAEFRVLLPLWPVFMSSPAALDASNPFAKPARCRSTIRPSTRSRTSTSSRPTRPACASSCAKSPHRQQSKAPTFENTIVAMERSGQLLARVSTTCSRTCRREHQRRAGRDRPRDVAEAGRHMRRDLPERQAVPARQDRCTTSATSWAWTPNRSSCSSAITRTSCAPAPSCPPPTRKS
jgi:hypothetical protein